MALKKMKILFICNQGQNRSKTAKELFKDEFWTMSAGLFNENPVTEEQLEWANLIVVMEEHQREELAKRFLKLYIQKRILCLDIPDVYSYNQLELKEILKRKFEKLKF